MARGGRHGPASGGVGGGVDLHLGGESVGRSRRAAGGGRRVVGPGPRALGPKWTRVLAISTRDPSLGGSRVHAGPPGGRRVHAVPSVGTVFPSGPGGSQIHTSPVGTLPMWPRVGSESTTWVHSW